jgi:hypothetical protein
MKSNYKTFKIGKLIYTDLCSALNQLNTDAVTGHKLWKEVNAVILCSKNILILSHILIRANLLSIL